MFRGRFIRGKAFLLSFAVIGVMVGAAACGGGGGGSSNSNSSSGTTVQVTEKEWSITVGGTELTKGNGDAKLGTGNVTFDIKNDGSVAHELEIQGQGIDQKSGSIDPGKSAKMTVNLKAGQYEIWCPIPGHKEAGMDGHGTSS